MCLRKKGVACPSLCVLCGMEEEHNWHLFTQCGLSKKSLEIAGLWPKIEEASHQVDGFSELVWLLLQKLEEWECKRAAMVLWSIWRARNVKHVDGVVETEHHINMRAADILKARETAHYQGGTPDRNERTNDARWIPPPSSRVKCNIDGALIAGGRFVGAGLCLRDHMGKFLGARTSWLRARMSPSEAGVWSLLQALLWNVDGRNGPYKG
ncbi:unnamed protein product [Cuscuta epithymum]|uniref:RNase H type-1 domain-containing protein n=1 Tax=Cuscuta epithymum TaxID=186058 RepID=A0AAV0DI43_9ASTE|nr:unnamed protein product [Cuscuta epithymum]